jgi:hypothetical protein
MAKLIAMCVAVELLAANVWADGRDFEPDCVLAGADAGTLEDLEIIAGHVWNAVGGADDGSVKVMDVDPKRFGVETAAGVSVTWLPGEEGDTKQIVLATLRPFKPMDLIITEITDDGDGTIAVVTGLTEIRNIEVNGVNQFTSKNPIPSQCFGSTLSAPRPKIRFDTVQTAPNLTMDMTYIGGTIAASASVKATATFSGVAVKR